LPARLKVSRKLSKTVFTAIRFSNNENPLPWIAIKVLLAEKFGVMPSAMDELTFPEVVEILAVLDGEGKASNLHT